MDGGLKPEYIFSVNKITFLLYHETQYLEVKNKDYKSCPKSYCKNYSK